MKVCIGERTFNDNVIGTARDVLRECIDKELSRLADSYGLQIANVVVPEHHPLSKRPSSCWTRSPRAG